MEIDGYSVRMDGCSIEMAMDKCSMEMARLYSMAKFHW